MHCNYDLLYKNECQNWRNKINKQKKKSDFPEERMEEINTAFDKFKKEALQRKKLVKTGKASPKEFTDWLYAQSTIIFKLYPTNSNYQVIAHWLLQYLSYPFFY